MGEDLVDSDAEEEFKFNQHEDCVDSSGDSEGSSGDELDDFSVEPSTKVYIEEKADPFSKGKTYPCTVCDKVFKREDYLKEHNISHTGVYPFYCESCGKGIKRERNLRKHNCGRKRQVSGVQKDLLSPTSPQISTAKLNKTYECKICHLSFDVPQRYSAHFSSSPLCKELTDKLNAGGDISDHFAPVNPTGLFRCSPCQFSTDNGSEFSLHIKTEEHVNTAQIDEFNNSVAKFKCNLCFYAADSAYKFNRHNSTQKHIDKEKAKKEEDFKELLNNPRMYTCLVCEKLFKDLGSLDEHVKEHNITKVTDTGKFEPEVTSRSGRKIKPKKFHDDVSLGGRKRTHDRESISPLKRQKVVIEGNSSDASKDSCADDGFECGICGEQFNSRPDHFTHMLTHVPPEIVKTLPQVEEGGVGWCPYCPGPVQLDTVEEHMEELHQDMEIEEVDLGLKVGEKKLEFDEIDPEELEALELAGSDRCVPKRLPG